jgi:hypothetical protein
MLQSTVGVASFAGSRDFDDQRVDPDQGDATVFAELGIAVTAPDLSRLGAMRTASDAQSAVASISPDLIHHAMADTSCVAGYRDGAADSPNGLGAAGGDGIGSASAAGEVSVAQFFDTADNAWVLPPPGSPHRREQYVERRDVSRSMHWDPILGAGSRCNGRGI